MGRGLSDVIDVVRPPKQVRTSLLFGLGTVVEKIQQDFKADLPVKHLNRSSEVCRLCYVCGECLALLVPVQL